MNSLEDQTSRVLREITMKEEERQAIKKRAQHIAIPVIWMVFAILFIVLDLYVPAVMTVIFLTTLLTMETVFAQIFKDMANRALDEGLKYVARVDKMIDNINHRDNNEPWKGN